MASLAISASATAVRSKDLISSPISEIRSEIGTLHHLYQLNQTLGPQLNNVIAIWAQIRRAITKDQPLDQVKNLAAALCKKYNIDQFKSELDSADSLEKLSSLAKRIITETKTMLAPPFTKATQGMKGPTILVRHYSSESVQHYPVEYVLKWTDWTEIGCSRIYNIFSHCVAKVNEPQNDNEFEVPSSAGIDLDACIYKLPNGEMAQIDEAAQADLKASLTDIMADLGLEPDFMKQLMVSQRIKEGATLLEFARTKYEALSLDNKNKIFERLGHIIVLDLLMGTFDRLAEICFNQNKYILDDIPSNLGNVMIEENEKIKDFTVFAIDNGCEQELVDNEERKKQYLDFLAEIFNEKDFDLIISKKTVASFQAECNAEDRKEELSSFVADLESIALPAMRHGICEMAVHLIKDMPEKLRELSALRDRYPALAEAVQERMKCFAQIMMRKS